VPDKPCAGCPLRGKNNAEWIKCAQASFHGEDPPIPCHLTLNRDEDGEYDIDTESQEVCRGYIIVKSRSSYPG